MVFIFDLTRIVFAADGAFEEADCRWEGVISLDAR